MFDISITHLLMYMNIVLLSFYVLVMYWYMGAGRRLFASATNWFIFWQLLMVIGTLISIDLDSAIDLWWLFIVMGGLLFFILGAIAANAYHRFNPRQEIHQFVNAPVEMNIERILPLLLLVGAVSAVVGIIFVRAVGYNVFTWAIANYISNEGLINRAEYSQLRTSISRESYVAAGYASQFTVILLPFVLYMLYFQVRQTKHWGLALVLILLTIGDIYFLTVKGGRLWLLTAMVTFYLLGSPFGPLPKAWRFPIRTTVFVLGSFVFYYSISTTLMGRVNAGTGDASSSIVGDLVRRIITTESQGHLLIMRFLLPEGAVWGREWWDGLITVLPGNAWDTTFNSDLHAFLYGGNSGGNLGLTVWGSLSYNWGTVGALILSFVLGFWMQCFTIMYVRGTRSMSRVIILFVAGLSLAQFRDPYSLLLNGFVTILLLYAMIKIIDRVSMAPARSLHVAKGEAA